MQKKYFWGTISALFIFGIFIATTMAIFIHAQLNPWAIWQSTYFTHIIWFSFYQAVLSTILSLVLALPISLALARRNFFGKASLMHLFNIIMVLPAIVAVLAILSIYGNSGFLNKFIQQTLNAKPIFNIYGLNGILITHVFFNLVLAIRVFYTQLQNISAENQILAVQLGMNFWTRFKLLEFYQIKQSLYSVAGLIFILCFTSFAIIATLGGGPKYSSLEVGIYEALYYSLDFNLAANLALWQIIFCLAILLILASFKQNITPNFSNVHNTKTYFRDSKVLKIGDFFVLALGIIFLIAPLLGLFLQTTNATAWRFFIYESFYSALLNSIVISFCAGFLAMFLAINLINAKLFFEFEQKKLLGNLFELSSNLILILPAMVLATGMFFLFYQYEDFKFVSYAIVIIINALMALPFIYKILYAKLGEFEARYKNLFLNLNITGWNKFYNFQYKALAPEFRQALSLAIVLSLGDITAIALFGNELQTLSMFLFKLMGSYKITQAWGLAVFILLLCFGVFSTNKIGLKNYARSAKY